MVQQFYIRMESADIGREDFSLRYYESLSVKLISAVTSECLCLTVQSIGIDKGDIPDLAKVSLHFQMFVI